MMLRPASMLVLLLGLLLVSCDRKQPNVLLILADDMGYYDVTAFRNLEPLSIERPPTCETPHIDRIAEGGMRFDDFYSGAAVCSPSRAALIAGRNCTRLGIYNWIPTSNPMHLREEEVTIADMLRKEGYVNGHFGKWHLGAGVDIPSPADQGFDHYFYTENNAIPSHHKPNNFVRNGKSVGELDGYSSHLVVDETLSWLKKQEGKDRPFFANVWFHEPHAPLAAPDSLKSRHTYNEEYYGAVENMDYAVGRLLDYLESVALLGNTIVLFASDNGSYLEGSNSSLRGRKAFNYQGGLRTPFLLRWDGKIEAGSSSRQLGSFVDILPTLAGLLGIEDPSPKRLDGMDLSAVALGVSPSVYRTEPVFYFRYFHDPVAMLREGDWVLLGYNEKLPYEEVYDTREHAKLKPAEGEPRWAQWGFQRGHQDYLLQQTINEFELFDVSNDPGQRNDVALQYPKRVDRMKEQMMALRAEMIAEGGDWYD
ncbi:MAG: sulfatase-like hydrolase/transferase [Bacteroidota bacterium]